MQLQSFNNWRKNHVCIEHHIFYPEGKNFRWGRFKGSWTEKTQSGHSLFHRCAFGLDFQTGDLYVDCSATKIWTKCIGLSLVCPINGLIKTGYHLFLPLLLGIKTAQKINKNWKVNGLTITPFVVDEIKHHIIDIFRTAIYTTAITIVSVAAVIIGPLAPRKLYEWRHVIGQLEKSLNRGEHTIWTVARCFQPIGNLMEIDRLSDDYLDSEYDNDPILHGSNNLTRKYVRFRRHNRNPFNDCCRLFPKNQAYLSPAYPI